ncbi:MAG TPA: hypothetical protein VFT70_19065 [Nocardioides sp.]|nr:hypothetical protein [Nocardioides sp.]
MTVPVRRLPDDVAAALTALDLAVGAVAVTASAAQATARTLRLTGLVERGARPFLRAGRSWRLRVVREVDHLLPLLVDLAVRRYVDLDGLVATVDLDAAAERLDVEAVIARVDLDAIAARIDVEAILDRLDLTATVLERVDLEAVVDGVLARIDLAALVEEVLDEVDLPEIIRESTGTMASDTVRNVRMQGVTADEAVTRVVDRLLMRHRPAPGAT